MNGDATGWVILGNQLFPPELLPAPAGAPVYMAEDIGLCTYVRHHKQKIVLFLAAMRGYQDELASRDLDVHYEYLATDAANEPEPYEASLLRWVRSRGIKQLSMWEIEDKFFEQRLRDFAKHHQLQLSFLPSPMFLTTREQFHAWQSDHKLFMADFYRWQRQRLHVLVNDKGQPAGGKWSFDADNRKALPRNLDVPLLRAAEVTTHVRKVIDIVRQRFADHPGELDPQRWWLPTTRVQALERLQDFLDQRLELFGPYEDAISERDPFLFHSVLTPALNLGLITPDEVVQQTLQFAQQRQLPISSVEGFIRQVIGWREFIRGVYQQCSARQEASNFFGHQRRLTSHWYDGTTGLLPLDLAIRKAQRWGWTHHIERLMVLGNLMTLCEIVPTDAHQWFMEMYVDSSDWVMGPNVYGMGTFADGGIFATKPYLCGSNYILKMSDYRKPRAGEPDWCETMDGLYWRFIDKHREFFAGQARLGRAVQLLDRMDETRRKRIFSAAEAFLNRVTEPGS